METVFVYSIVAFMYVTMAIVVACIADAVIGPYRSRPPRNKPLSEKEKEKDRMEDAIRIAKELQNAIGKSGGEWFDV